MRISRFYLNQTLSSGARLTLSETVFRHAIQVLRLSEGDSLLVFNGQGGEYQATLIEVARRHALLELGDYRAINPESALQLTLVQALIKPDKMDFALQKAVELGIHAFQPLMSRRSVVQLHKDKIERKLEHWQAIAISACEQSGRTRLPLILPPLSLNDYLAQTQQATKTRLILAPEATVTFANFTAKYPQAIDLLIGPEGGFTTEEVEQCQQAGLQNLRLGTRILRAETASVTALSLLQQRYGDL